MSNDQKDTGKAEELQLYDDEVQEVIHRVPHWMVRIGATLLLVVIMIIIVVAWIIRYPDIIEADIKITTQYPPAYISSYTTGKVEHLWVGNNQSVEKGEPLLVIENPADYDDVVFVQQSLNISGDLDELWGAVEEKDLRLGELQPSYNRFYKSLADYFDYLEVARIPAQIRTLEQELDMYDELYRHQQDKIAAQHRDYELAVKQYNRDSLLYSNQVISDAEWDKASQTLLEKQINLRNAITELDQIQLSMQEKKSDLQHLRLTHREQLNDYNKSIREAKQALLAEIAIWHKKYVITSPISGTATFTIFVEENITIQENTELISIIPENTGDVIGKVNISFQGAGKVKVGQHVNIKLNDYPYLEFGIVSGKIKSLSRVAGERYYAGMVELPQGLVTNNQYQIEYRQDMTGQAEIITNNMRFIERVLNPLQTLRNIQGDYKELE